MSRGKFTNVEIGEYTIYERAEQKKFNHRWTRMDTDKTNLATVVQEVVSGRACAAIVRAEH
jgi:hypothetical protein